MYLKNVLVKVLLKSLVGVVDTKLLKAVRFEILEPKSTTNQKSFLTNPVLFFSFLVLFFFKIYVQNSDKRTNFVRRG